MTEIVTTKTPTGESLVEVLVTRVDAYINELVGMGGAKDPSVYTSAQSRGIGLSDATVEALYAEDDMAARIVDMTVQHALRSGWDLVLPGDPQAAAVQRKAYLDLEAQLGVPRALDEGARWGRLWGGAVTWIGVADGQGDAGFLDRQSLPLDLDAVDRVRFIHSFDRREVQVETTYTDPLAPRYRHPAQYKITPNTSGPRAYERDPLLATITGGVVVHESRLIVWPGALTDRRRKASRSGWDDSVLERAWDPLRAAAEDFGAKSGVLNRISQFIFKLKGLGAMIMSDETKLRKRLGLLDSQRSRGRALVMDIEEAAEQITQPIAGLDVVIDKSVARVAGAGGTPATIFTRVGVTPADQAVWDEDLDAWRKDVLQPRHERIAEIMLRSKSGPTAGVEPETWDIVYRPLHTPPPKERAELRKLRAETDAIEIDKGIIPPEAVALHRHTTLASGEGEVPLDTAEVSAALERRRELAKQPPKDNAELGTVGARAAAAIDVVTKVTQRQISRVTGLEILTQFFRLAPEDAERMVGPEDFTPAPPVAPGKPGPAPDPALGVGAGAPQGLPGFDDGGAPKAKALPPEGQR